MQRFNGTKPMSDGTSGWKENKCQTCGMLLRSPVDAALSFTGDFISPQRERMASPAAETVVATAATSPARFDPAKLRAIDAAIEVAIQEKKLPGGVLWIEQLGADDTTDSQRYTRVYGHRSVQPEVESMTADTIFDAASLTKILVTSTAIMQLVDRRQMAVDDRVAKHLPAFGTKGKDAITVRHLMTHMSGLAPSLPTPFPWKGHAGAVDACCSEQLANPIGAKFVYSDIGFIVLGAVVQRVSGQALECYAQEHIFQPLGMTSTTYLPAVSLRSRIAPCDRLPADEQEDGDHGASTSSGMLRGCVHDPTARRMGGVAGHAGVFTSAADLARFGRMILRSGQGDNEGERVLSSESARELLRPQNAPCSDVRGLGWDIDSSFSGPRGDNFSPAPPHIGGGHTGWTGGSIWLVVDERLVWLFLSNRLHPDGPAVGDVKQLRRDIGTLVAEAIGVHSKPAE